MVRHGMQVGMQSAETSERSSLEHQGRRISSYSGAGALTAR